MYIKGVEQPCLVCRGVACVQVAAGPVQVLEHRNGKSLGVGLILDSSHMVCMVNISPHHISISLVVLECLAINFGRPNVAVPEQTEHSYASDE